MARLRYDIPHRFSIDDNLEAHITLNPSMPGQRRINRLRVLNDLGQRVRRILSRYRGHHRQQDRKRQNRDTDAHQFSSIVGR